MNTCTMKMIADTIGGPITIARTILFTMSFRNNNIVCCTAPIIIFRTIF